MTKSPVRALALVALVAAATGLVACTSTVTPPTPTPPNLTPAAATPSDTPTPTPTPSPTPTPDPVNPLTGLGPVPAGTVVAVKIDDTSGGRPQRGIDQADIVYVEQAEGGLTRLLALFASTKPVVEAVRSVRTSDPELLSEYGHIVLVASGGGGDSISTLDASIVKAVLEDRNDKGFVRDNNRGAPYNLTSNLATVTASYPGNPVQDIGLTWSAIITPGAPGAAVNTKVGSTAVNFGYDPTTSRYVRFINGVAQKAADGAVISTPNVIVQYCTITPNYNDIDTNGQPGQYTHTIGTGPAIVFRNGQRIEGTWSRASATSGTTFTSAAGTPIALAPGGAWVLLDAPGTPVTS